MTFVHIKSGSALVAGVLTTLAMLMIIPSARADFKSFGSLNNQKNQSFCMGIGGGISGTTAGLFKCDGQANQQYRLTGGHAQFTILIRDTNKCLLSAGGLVKTGSCGSASAKWQLTNPRGGAQGLQDARFASIKNQQTGACIGVSGGQIFHGAEIGMFGCDNSSFGNQNWLVNPTGTLIPSFL
jgi:hypothetical protein